MRAELLKRLFRAVLSDSPNSTENILATIIDDERKKGHGDLANQLEHIYSTSRNKAPDEGKGEATSRGLLTLPTSKRHNAPLGTLKPARELRHHMVLRADIEKRFQRIEKEYAARGRLSKFGLSPVKKILLYGNPGCGKSLGAERLAHNLGLPLLRVRFDSIISSYLGESSTNLRSIFDSTLNSPCVLLLDECDFIARSRTDTNDVGEAPRIVNTLLQLLEDYSSPGLLVATTNIQKSLDKAIFRRFDEVIEIPKPEAPQIVELLRSSLSAMPVSPCVRWDEIVRDLEGYSAAFVEKVAQNAAKASILNLNDRVEEADLCKAIEELDAVSKEA